MAAGCFQAIAGKVKTIVKNPLGVGKTFPGSPGPILPIAKPFLSIVKVAAGVVPDGLP